MNKLQIEYVDINSIKPYKNNAKEHPEEQIEQIKKSIEQFGMDDPIGIWKDEIVEGHGRLIACKELGYTEVPIIRLDHLTDEERKAYTLAHNKLTMNSGFDMDMLSKELESLTNMDMSQYGFEDDLSMDVQTEVIEDEYNESPPEQPKSKLGDIYQIGEHRLMCGDSTSEEDVAKLMNGVKADMVFTDPPYGIDVVGDNGTIGKENKAKAGVYSKVIGDETTETARKAYEILAQYSDKQILWGGNYFVDFLPFSDGWIIWDKRVDSPSNNFADGEMAWCSFHTRVRIYHHLWMGMIQEGEREKRVHPTQKPIKMVGDVLKDFTEKHESILDVFGGSGSTLIACEQLGRKCYMMEYDPKYVDVIIDRWEQFTGKKAIKIN